MRIDDEGCEAKADDLDTFADFRKWLYDHYLKLMNNCVLVPGWGTATVRVLLLVC